MTLHTMGPRRARRTRWISVAAVSTAATVTLAVAIAGGGVAGAASAPNAQSAGNFLDATAGGNPIDPVLLLAFARAQNPGSVTDQNPLDVTVLNTINLPLTGALQFPQLLGITVGAANQVAMARSTGASYGASGAVLNSGAVSVGGDNAAVPSNATIDLSASGITGNSGVPVPGGTGTADALGDVTASIGAVSSIARVPAFGPPLASSWLSSCAADAATCYQIAALDLAMDSPLVGQVFTTISSQLASVLSGLATTAGGVGLPPECTFDAGLTSISLEGGAVVVDPTAATIAINVKDLVTSLLGKDLNGLPANTDLTKVVTDYLASPSGLAAGLSGAINALTTPLSDKFSACLTAMQSSGPIGAVAGLLLTLTTELTAGETQVTTTLADIVTALSAAASPLAPLGDVLGQLVDLGANIQPGVSSGDFTTALDALPKQGMTAPPVPYQYVVRALEVQILGGTATVGLANSAAGPSQALRGSDSANNPKQPRKPTKPKQPAVVNSGLGTPDQRPPLAPLLLGLGLVIAGGLGLYRRALAATVRGPRS
jgi:hypothetical protein